MKVIVVRQPVAAKIVLKPLVRTVTAGVQGPPGPGGVTDHLQLSNVGSSTHASIDTALVRLADTNGVNTGDQDLSGLAALAGEPGGQTINGGTAAGENLTLSSTANATHGKLLFGTSVYDEALNRLGIGVTSPASALHVKGGLRMENTANNQTALLLYSQPYYGRLNYSVTAANSRSEVRFVSAGALAGAGQTYFVIASTEAADTGNNLLLGIGTGRAFMTNAVDYSAAGTLHLGGQSWAENGVVQLSGRTGLGTGVMAVTGVMTVTSAVTATQYKLSALNTAPASATAAGTLGEIRITADFIYVCIATNTWVRSALGTW